MTLRPLVLLLLAACGDAATEAATATPDAAPALPGADAAGTEDLDMGLADFAALAARLQRTARGYKVANLLGHDAEALAAASSATGGSFPVGTVVEVQASEAMVKRRAGWNAATNDWEFIRLDFAGDGTTPMRFAVRGAEETACFSCHAMVSSLQWDYICVHP